jgi:RimJ/RimL family protein N-acetyltransferase
MPDEKPLQVPHARPPVRAAFTGRHVRLEPLDPLAHLDDLFAAADDETIWDWLGYGPFTDKPAMRAWLEDRAMSVDPLFFAVRDLRDGRARGMCAWLRLDPTMGVIEIGHIWYGTDLQRTAGTTEAMYLLFRHAFEERGYRRLEWKCNALNARSRNAALRFGFSYEGNFRQHMITKAKNRDTAWFSLLDREWPATRAGFERWLAPANFKADGAQIARLGDLIAAARSG